MSRGSRYEGKDSIEGLIDEIGGGRGEEGEEGEEKEGVVGKK